MSNLYPIKAGFSGGVISPSAQGRVDSERYAMGMSACANFIVTAQGSLRLRRGMAYVGALLESAVDVRLINFQVSAGDDAVVVLDGEKVTLYKRQGIIEGAGLFAQDPYLTGGARFWKKRGTTNALARWKYEPGYRTLLQQYDVSNTEVDSKSRIGFEQKIVAPADTYRLRFAYASQAGKAPTTDPDDPVQQVINFFSRKGEVLVGSTPGAQDIFYKELPISDWVNPIEYDETFVTAGTEFYITFRLQGQIVSYSTGAFYAPILLSGSDTSPQEFASPWDGTQVAEIQVAQDTGTGQMFLVHPEVAPQLLSYDALTRAWSFAPVAFVDPPPEWTTNNYPSAVEVFQGRLWLSGTPVQGNTIWASKVGAYEVFTTGANPDDPLDLQLASSGRVLWMLGMDQILIGTENGEVIIGSRDDAITNSSFFIDRQNGYSMTRIRAIYAGRQIAYVGASRQLIRVTEPSEEARGMKGQDVSFMANSLFVRSIKELAYAVEPQYQLYVPLQSGDMAVCTYDNQNSLLAWYTMDTRSFGNEAAGGDIESVCITQEVGGQAVWLAVRRNGAITLEVIEPDLFVRRFLDSYVYRPVETIQTRPGAYSRAFSSAYSGGYVDSETTQGVVSGLTHLEGSVVGIVYENPNTEGGVIQYEVLPQQAVTDGKIFVPNYVFGSVCVGLPYTGRAVTLPQEGGNQAGTAQGTKRKWNRVFSRLAFSAVPMLNGYRAKVPDNLVPPSGNPLDADVTGDFEIRSEGFDEGIVIIEQDLPLRTEIAGIFGKSQSNAT